MSTRLAEDLLLLTAHPTRGTLGLPRGLALPRALAGAAIHDCLACGAARLERGRLVATGGPGTSGPVVEHVLARLSPRERTLDRTIDVLAAPRTRLGQHLLHSLSVDGLLVRSERHLLGVLSRRPYAATDRAAVATLRTRVAGALFGPVDDARLTALAHLVTAGDLYRLAHVDPTSVHFRSGRPSLGHDPIATAVAETIRRARRDAATAGAVAATAGAVVASGS